MKAAGRTLLFDLKAYSGKLERILWMFKGLLQTPGKLLYLLIFFFYVFDVNFSFMPVTSSVAIGFIGAGLMIAYMLRKNIDIERKSIKVICLMVMLALCWLASVMYNQSADYSFLIKEMFRNNFLIFTGAFLMAFLCSDWNINVRDGLKCFVFVSTIQCVIILICFFVPAIGTSLRSLQSIDERVVVALDDGIRAFGLGAGFDRGAFIMSFFLIITCYLYLTCGEDEKRWKYIIIYILQAFAGLLMARSIVTGIACSLLYMLLNSKKGFVVFKFVLKIAAVLGSLIAAVMTIFPDLLQRYKKTVVWLTEFFNTEKLAAAGKTTNTLNTLEGMYFAPEKFSTWIIGDGYYLGPNGHPYMTVDPFYMRYLLLFGVTGIVIFLAFIIALVVILKADGSDYYGEAAEHKNAYNLMLFVLFLQQLVVYLKVDFHFYFIVYYLIWLEFFNKKKFPVRNELSESEVPA